MYEPSRKDARLLQRALRQGWDVPVKLRTKIMKVLSQIVSDEKSTAREKTSAARAVVSATRVELDAIRVAHVAQLVDLAGRVEALEGGTDAGLAKSTDGD